jgi:putative transposase
VHIVFGTKDRLPMIPDIQLCRRGLISPESSNLGAKAYAVGGRRDHVHIFVGLPATAKLAEIVQKIKANSSRWMHEDAGVKLFSWQESYAAFSISMSRKWKLCWKSLDCVPSLAGLVTSLSH